MSSFPWQHSKNKLQCLSNSFNIFQHISNVSRRINFHCPLAKLFVNVTFNTDVASGFHHISNVFVLQKRSKLLTAKFIFLTPILQRRMLNFPDWGVEGLRVCGAGGLGGGGVGAKGGAGPHL